MRSWCVWIEVQVVCIRSTPLCLASLKFTTEFTVEYNIQWPIRLQRVRDGRELTQMMIIWCLLISLLLNRHHIIIIWVHSLPSLTLWSPIGHRMLSFHCYTLHVIFAHYRSLQLGDTKNQVTGDCKQFKGYHICFTMCISSRWSCY